MSSLLLLDCYLWESSRALVDDITAMAAAAFSDWTRCVNFFCTAPVFVVINEDSEKQTQVVG